MPTFGPEIRPPGHYTHCVASADYQDPPSLAQSGVFSFFQFMLCEYLLGGKLVCLAGGQDECAIGTVVGLEAVGAGKKGFDALDNDFSFNVLLAPFQTQDFRWYWQDAWHVQQPGVADNVVDPHRVRDDLVRNGPSGWMMVDPKNAPVPLPQPVDQSGAPHWPIDKRQDPGTATWPVDGYGVLWRLKGAFQNFTGLGVTVEYYDLPPEGDNLHKLWDTPSNDEWPAPPGPGDPTSPDLFVPIPVLHCECEGSRIFAVCQAMDPFLNLLTGKAPGGGPGAAQACHAFAKKLTFGLDKIGHAVCSIVEDIVGGAMSIAMAPYMAAAFAAAWASAQAYDDLLVTGPVAKQIHINDIVIVKGRWDWDAGHSGHAELHPVKSIQKLMTVPGRSIGDLPEEVRPKNDLSTHPLPTPVSYDPRQEIPSTVADDIEAVWNRWCRMVGEAPPPPDPTSKQGLSAAQLASLTAEQRAVWAAQNQPQNMWNLHPLIDGCVPDRPPGTPVR